MHAVTIAMDAIAITSAAAVLSITVWKTLSQVRSASSLGMNMNLSQTLLRDGKGVIDRKYILTNNPSMLGSVMFL